MSGQGRSFSIPDWTTVKYPSGITLDGPVAAPLYPPSLTVEQWKKPVSDGLASFLQQEKRQLRHVLLIVEDASRPSDTAPVIQCLTDTLQKLLPQDATLNLLIAGGAHVGLEKANARKVPPNFPGRIRVHDCRNAVSAGYINDAPLLLDPTVLEADLRIAVGTVNIHPKAGFSGGAKILVPGCAGLPTIFALHNLGDGKPGELDTPIRRFADQVLARFPVEFSVQLLTDQNGRILRVSTGDLGRAWRDAANALISWVILPLSAPFPFCIADSSPFDQNLLGIFKALPALISALEPKGIGYVLSQAPQGLGDHLWRLNSEIMDRERGSWEAKLGERKVNIITEARIPQSVWRTVFPRQLLYCEEPLPIPPVGEWLAIRSAPLVSFKYK